MELLFDYLKGIKVDKAIIKALRDQMETKSEEFNIEDLVSKHKGNQEDLFLATKKKAIEEDYENRVKEDRYLDTIKPIQNKIVKLLPFTREEIEGKGIKDIIDLAGEKIAGIEAAKVTKGQEEMAAELNDWKTKFQSLVEERETEKRLWENENSKIKEATKSEITEFKVRAKFNDLASSKDVVEWDDPMKLPLYKKSMYSDLVENYTPLENGGILDKDGVTKAVWKDENGETIIDNQSHYMKLWAEKNNAVKRSNGDEEQAQVTRSASVKKFGDKEIDFKAINELEKVFNK